MTKVDKDVYEFYKLGILSKHTALIASFEASIDITATLLNDCRITTYISVSSTSSFICSSNGNVDRSEIDITGLNSMAHQFVTFSVMQVNFGVKLVKNQYFLKWAHHDRFHPETVSKTFLISHF